MESMLGEILKCLLLEITLKKICPVLALTEVMKENIIDVGCFCCLFLVSDLWLTSHLLVGKSFCL